MKRICTFYFLLLTLAMGMQMSAQDFVVINVTKPGTSEDAILNNDGAEKVRFTGKISKLDFNYINAYFYNLQELDLSACTIEAATDAGENFPANEMPSGLAGMGKLKKVTLPSSCTSIAKQAFVFMNSLQEIVIPSKTLPTTKGKIIESSKLTSVKLYVDGSILKDYKAADAKVWGFASILPIPGTEVVEEVPALVTIKMKAKVNSTLRIQLIGTSTELSLDAGDGNLQKLVVSDEVPKNLADVKSIAFTTKVADPTIKIIGKGILLLNFSRFYLGGTSPQIESIDLSNAPDLEVLGLDNVNLPSLDVTKNPELKVLYPFGNLELKTLDVSKNTKLKDLQIQYTAIEELDLSQATELEKIICNKSKLKNLDLSHSPNLIALFCEKTPIESVNIEGLSKLVDLRLNELPNLTKLSLKENVGISSFQVGDTKLQTIDFSQIPNVRALYFDKTLIETADLSQLEKLETLGANNAKLKMIKVSPKAKIKSVKLWGNQLDACALDNFFLSLAKSASPATIYPKATDKFSNPGLATCKTFIATEKNYRVLDGLSGKDVKGDNTGCDNGIISSIDEILENRETATRFKVYPTTVDNGFEVTSPSEIKTISILNLEGKTLISNSSISSFVNTRALAQGRYVVLIEAKDGAAEVHIIQKK